MVPKQLPLVDTCPLAVFTPKYFAVIVSVTRVQLHMYFHFLFNCKFQPYGCNKAYSYLILLSYLPERYVLMWAGREGGGLKNEPHVFTRQAGRSNYKFTHHRISNFSLLNGTRYQNIAVF